MNVAAAAPTLSRRTVRRASPVAAVSPQVRACAHRVTRSFGKKNKSKNPIGVWVWQCNNPIIGASWGRGGLRFEPEPSPRKQDPTTRGASSHLNRAHPFAASPGRGGGGGRRWVFAKRVAFPFLPSRAFPAVPQLKTARPLSLAPLHLPPSRRRSSRAAPCRCARSAPSSTHARPESRRPR
jgi:hypothetical protein